MIVIVVFIMILELVRTQRTEQSMRFVLDSGGERQGIARTRGSIIAEHDAPKAFDGDRFSVLAAQQSFELAVSIECRDLAAAELTDENAMAPLSEIRRRLCQPPGCVHPFAMLQAH